MRIQARLHDYNDARGFGFVTPEGGERAFVHIKAFASPGVARRPVNGDQLSFELQRDAQGRLLATGVRFAGGQRSSVPTPAPGTSGKRPVRAFVALGFLAAVCAAWLAGVLPAILPLAYMLMSLLSLAVYALDKSAARSGARRVPEKHLHLLDLLCGWPGSLLAQGLLHHKSSKRSFQITFWFSVLLNLAGVYAALHSGALHQVQQAVQNTMT